MPFVLIYKKEREREDQIGLFSSKRRVLETEVHMASVMGCIN